MVFLLETFAEVFGNVETRTVSNLRDVQFRIVFQHVGCSFQTDSDNQVVRSLPGDGFQFSKQLGTCNAHSGSQLVYVEVGIVYLFFNDGHCLVQEFFIEGIGCQYLHVGLGLFAELLLQHDTAVYQIVATRQQQVDVEWFGYVVVGSHFQPLHIIFDSCFSCEQHYRNVAEVKVFFDGMA